MERLRILQFDSIDSIGNHLDHLGERDIVVGPDDKLQGFLDISRIEYDVIDAHDLSDEICNPKIVKHVDDKKTENAAVCYSCNNEVSILSLYYAIKKDCNLIFANDVNVQSLIEKASKEYERCCIITDEQAVSSIQTIISTLDNGSFGIIAGRDSWETLYIINKSITGLNKETHNIVCVDRTDHTENSIKRSDQYTYIPFSESSANKLLEIIDEVADVFSFMGHGRDEGLWLKNGLLCSGMIQDGKTGNLPNCRTTGKCFIDDTEVLPISEIPALNVFVNACLTGKIGTAFYGNEHNVAQLFLGENAITYMGTPFLGKPLEAVVNYYVSLVMAGIKMGEVCRIINSFYKRYQIGINNEFYLFGDPDFCFNSSFPVYRYDISGTEENITFELHAKSSLIILNYDGNLFDDFFALKREVTLVNESNQPIYCNMIHDENAKKTILHVFSRGLLEEGVYHLSIRKPKISQQWDIDNIIRINDLIRMGLTNSKTELFYNESINAVENFKQGLNYNMARLDTIRKTVYSKYHKLLNRMESLHRSIVQEVHRKVHVSGLYIEDYYMEYGFTEVSKVLSDHKCRYCGNCFFDIGIANKLFGIKRKHGFCLRCGNVSSAPNQATLNIYIKCEERQPKNKTKYITLCIENNGHSTSVGIASVAIKSGKKRYNAIYRPEQVTFEIPPAEKHEIKFEIDTEGDIPNRYSTLAGIVLADNHFCTAARSVYFYDDPN